MLAPSGEAGAGRLLENLIAESEKNAVWTFKPAFSPRMSSIRLHRHCGFRKVGIGAGSRNCMGSGAIRCCWSGAAGCRCET
jgi:L-amino acid N-acyltransferase YncA